MIVNYVSKILIAINLFLVIIFFCYIFSKPVSAAATITVENLQNPLTEEFSQQDGIPLRFKGSTSATANVSVNISTNGQCQVTAPNTTIWSNSTSYGYSHASNAWPTTFESVAHIRATQDLINEGSHNCIVAYDLTSSDPAYNDINGTKTFIIRDNDQVGATLTNNLTSANEGQVVFFAFRSEGQPNADINYTINVAGDCFLVKNHNGNYSEYTKSKTFTHSSATQGVGAIIYVYLSMNNDESYNSGRTCIASGFSTSLDNRYNEIMTPKMTISINDNDPKPSAAPEITEDSILIPTGTYTAPAEDPGYVEQLADLDIATDGITIKQSDGSIVDPQKKFILNLGADLIFEGTTTPNSKVIITIFSDPLKFSAFSDSKGNYKITATNIPEGNHHAELVVLDPETNEASQPITIAQFYVNGNSNQTEDKESPIDGLTIPDNNASTTILITFGVITLAASTGTCYWWWLKRKTNLENT